MIPTTLRKSASEARVQPPWRETPFPQSRIPASIDNSIKLVVWNHENIRVILDKDSEICGIYPLDENDEQHYQESFGFIGELGRPTDLFYLQTEPMDKVR